MTLVLARLLVKDNYARPSYDDLEEAKDNKSRPREARESEDTGPYPLQLLARRGREYPLLSDARGAGWRTDNVADDRREED